MKTINLQEIKEQLYSNLKESGWGPAMVNTVMSSDFDNVLLQLLKESQNGKRFTPKIKYLFRAFEACPYDNLSVVIIGQDPYPQIDTADGIAFSCSLTGRIEKSLEYIFKSIEKTTRIICTDPDLSRWSKQGVLMLNSSLTTTINKPGSHKLLWRPFIVSVLDYLVWNKPNLVYVFLGKTASELSDLIPSNNLKIHLTHPASTAYNNEAEWDCQDVWNKINNYLNDAKGSQIKW